MEFCWETRVSFVPADAFLSFNVPRGVRCMYKAIRGRKRCLRGPVGWRVRSRPYAARASARTLSPITTARGGRPTPFRSALVAAGLLAAWLRSFLAQSWRSICRDGAGLQGIGERGLRRSAKSSRWEVGGCCARRKASCQRQSSCAVVVLAILSARKLPGDVFCSLCV